MPALRNALHELRHEHERLGVEARKGIEADQILGGTRSSLCGSPWGATRLLWDFIANPDQVKKTKDSLELVFAKPAHSAWTTRCSG